MNADDPGCLAVTAHTTSAEVNLTVVPITLHPDGRKSHPPHLKTFRDGWRTLRFFMMYSPKWLFLIPGLVLIAAGLGFLGLGVQPPLPEWGLMISSGRKFLFEQWWVATMPGLAIVIVSLGFNLLGDGLRRALDPRQA